MVPCLNREPSPVLFEQEGAIPAEGSSDRGKSGADF